MIKINVVLDSYDISISTSLDGVNYVMRFRWSSLSKSWFLYISNNNNSFFYKTRLTTARDLLEPVKYLSYCPQGLLFVGDDMKTFGRPSRNDFGFNKRFSLYYISEDELDAMAS